MEILRTIHLKKYYGEGETCVKALDDVNFSVEKGEFVSIVGTSGSGKSTLLHMLGGLDRPTSGEVVVDGKNLFPEKRGPHHFPAAENRLCLPELQSGAGAECL